AIAAARATASLTLRARPAAGTIPAGRRGGRSTTALVMIASILPGSRSYLSTNVPYLHGCGIHRPASPGADGGGTLTAITADTGVFFISLLVILAALTSTNATIFTGARTNHALGRDFSVFSFVRTWKSETSTPVNALLAQGAIAVFLIVIGSFARSGFESMVDFTAPIFWFFILCTGLSLFVLDRKSTRLNSS